jgi:hypothetical protein
MSDVFNASLRRLSRLRLRQHPLRSESGQSILERSVLATVYTAIPTWKTASTGTCCPLNGATRAQLRTTSGARGHALGWWYKCIHSVILVIAPYQSPSKTSMSPRRGVQGPSTPGDWNTSSLLTLIAPQGVISDDNSWLLYRCRPFGWWLSSYLLVGDERLCNAQMQLGIQGIYY